MKIIKQGRPPAEPPPPEWAGIQINCLCGCMFELEAGDELPPPLSNEGPPSNSPHVIRSPNVTYYAERHPGGARYILVRCPSCKNMSRYALK